MNVEANRLSVYITEEGFELDYITEENLNDEENALLSLCQKNKFEFLIELAFIKEQALSISLTFLQYVARTFLQAIANDPKFNFSKAPYDCELDDKTICKIIENAPYIIGLEFINEDWVLNILVQFNVAYKNVVEKSQKTPMEYLLSKGNFFIIPSRIYFHLVENKDNDEFPFAFLATYTAIENGKLIHCPLKNALTQLKSDKNKLSALVSSITEATKESTLIKKFVESGNIFYPTKLYNSNDRTIDESMISDIFGIELGSLSIAPTSDGDVDDAPKTTDIVRVIEIKPSTSTTPIEKSKTVIRQYNLDGVFMNQFDSYEEAANKTHIHRSQISEACNGSREIAGEYQWRIADSTDAKININKYIPPIDYALLINCPIQQLDTSGNLVEEFVSAVEASRKTNISINWIRDALSGRQQQAGGFVWKLLDAIEERPSQEVVSAYQRQDVARIKQVNFERQHQKILSQQDEKKKEQERIELERQKQEELKRQEFLRKQEEDRKQRELENAQRREETRKRQEKIDKQKASYRNQGLCQHCGGTFKKKFLFFTSDICSRCGKKKDY